MSEHRFVVMRQGVPHEVIVDEEMRPAVECFTWHVGKNGYVRTARGLVLHLLVFGLGPGKPDVDHINGNRLDNRKANLRCATRTQNNANAVPKSHSKQPFKGVRRAGTRWSARLRMNGREFYLGRFDTAEDAARAYDAAARTHFGRFARLNFGGAP